MTDMIRITNYFCLLYKIDVGISSIGVVTHPVTRQWPGGPEGMPGSTRSNAGCYSVKSLVLLCTGNWLLLIPHVDQGFTAHLADGNAGSA